MDILEEWQTEPSELNFVYRGYNCMIKRIEGLGHLCGYVEVTNAPAFDTDEIVCHGCITFEGSFTDVSGEWIGFDCAHYNDLIPYVNKEYRFLRGQIYRNIDFVKKQCELICDQLFVLTNTK